MIFGAKGLIGNSLLKHFKKKKEYRVIGIDLAKSKNIESCDITNENDVIKIYQKIFIKYKRIDAVINAAYPKSKSFGKSFTKMSYNEFGLNMNLNLGSLFLLIKHATPFFKKNKHSNFIGVSSIYGSITPNFKIYENTPIKFPFVYAPIKSAQIMIIKYFAKYFVHKKINISINSLSPGGVYNNQNKKFYYNYKKFCKSKGMVSATELISTTEFLLAKGSKSITGQDIKIDDGFSI